MSQSALSQIIRGLEERMSIRRSVTPTQIFERLFPNVEPKFDEMDVELAALSELCEKPAAGDFAARIGADPSEISGHQGRGLHRLGLADIVAAHYDTRNLICRRAS